MGELAEGVGHAPCSGTQHSHYAVRIQIWLVRTGLSQADRSHGSTDAAVCAATEEGGMVQDEMV
jgi:hypothetical protein